MAGIDFGGARIGVAVSDELRAMAHARPPIDGKNKRKAIAQLAAMAREDDIERFVVGLPLEMTGEEGPSARRASDFAHELAAATGLDVELIDERLTTVEATRRLTAGGARGRERQARVDGEAARVILETWLAAQSESSSHADPVPHKPGRDRK